MLIMGIYAVILPIYIGGLIYSSKDAKVGFLAILIVFLGIQFLSFFGDPISLFKGLIFKIVFVYFIILGIMAGGRLKNIKERLIKLGAGDGNNRTRE